MTDLNVMPKQSSTNGSANISDLEPHEISKDNNISIFDPPSMDEIPDTSVSAASPHPAGIKLSRAGYYTIPSMEDLGEMVDVDGSCLVENFTVGRYGYGNICFQGITNVAGIDLDSCVFIVRKEVEVYPEGVLKPPPGEELNKPAFITLDCVWPVDKSTHEVIKCQERLDAMGWPQYLEKQCMKMEATFVEYRPETGSWVFKVKHFSKYGLQDEENEPPPSSQAVQMEKDRSTGKGALPSKESVMTTNEVPSKTPLSLANYPSPLPMFGGRVTSSQGPPAMALTSPPQHTIPSPLVPEAVPIPVRKKVFLDGSSVDVQEDGFESVIKETDDSLLLWPLSPSAERLTLSSKAPPRAIQTLKSQLFFNDQEEGFEDDLKILGHHPSEKGEKREYSRRETVTPGRETSILGRSSSKKIILGNQSFVESSILVGDRDSTSPAMESMVEKQRKSAQSPSLPEIHHEPEPTPRTSLREPRTEYQLLSSAPDPNFDLGKEVVSHISERIPLQQSLSSKVPRGIADASCFMGRSFRVGWGPCLTLVHCTVDDQSPSTETQEREEETTAFGPLYLFGGSEKAHGIREQKVVRPHNLRRYNLAVQKIHLLKDRGTDSKAGNVEPMHEACLQNVLECSVLEQPPPADLTIEESGIVEKTSDLDSLPLCLYFKPEKGIDLLHRLSLSAAQLDDRDDTLSSVFDLCCALWGRLDFFSPDSNGESIYALEQARKEALSVWLEEVNEEVVEGETERALQSEAEEGYLDAVFSHLTARQISKACEVCQDKGDHHLALLLSQACLGDETPRHIMNEQLSNWSWSGLDAHMSFSRLALYTLLGGTPTHESSQGSINTLVGLDWRRCVALFMWYMCPVTASIAEVITEYESAAGLGESKERGICEEPKPSYLANHCIPENGKVNNDVCFQLLKLYVDRSHSLETLLETSAYTNDPMDVTASWLLWSILQSLDYTLLPAAKSEALHTSMAALLESHGSWHWAAFVTLCIPNENKRKRDLMDLLSRHLLVEGEDECSDPFYREKEQFILTELHVPEPFVHKAKAIRAKSLHLVDEEAWYLIQAGQYNLAHDMILDSIAPNAVINEDHDFLMSYLNEFLKRGITEKVIDWQNGGDIYLAYLEVIQQVNELRKTRHPTVSKVEKLRPRLMALCLRLNNLKCPTAVHRLCISEMSRMVVSVLRAILSEDPEGIRVLAQQVSSLPLTHECALEELNHITHQYLSTLAQDSMETT